MLHTFIDHIAYQLNETIKNKKAKVLVTGGGAFNEHIIEKLTIIINLTPNISYQIKN